MLCCGCVSVICVGPNAAEDDTRSLMLVTKNDTINRISISSAASDLPPSFPPPTFAFHSTPLRRAGYVGAGESREKTGSAQEAKPTGRRSRVPLPDTLSRGACVGESGNREAWRAH